MGRKEERTSSRTEKKCIIYNILFKAELAYFIESEHLEGF